MKHEQEIRFINGGPDRLLLVIEPASSEFRIDCGASVRLLVAGGVGGGSMEIEYLPGGMVIYLSADAAIQVFQNGRRLAQGKRTRHMEARLGQRKATAGSARWT